MSFFNKLFSKIESILCRPWVNPFMTIYLNFRLCRFKDAIKFPLFIYGGCYLDNTLGKISFPNGCYRGMVKIGCMCAKFGAPKGKTFICLSKGSLIIFHGPALFLIDVAFRLSENAVVEFGSDILVGDDVKIMAEYRIQIGNGTRIAFGSKFLDTNFHYMVDLESGSVRRKNKEIIIGCFNWIGNGVSIMKGCCTPDYAIVGAGSVANKNYGNIPNIIIAGGPAKVIKEGVQRIFDFEKEREIDDFFKNSNEDFFFLK